MPKLPSLLKITRLWSPDSPFLYDLDVMLVDGKTQNDKVSSYFGMRKISIGQVGGYQKMLLNNKFVFQLGPLDQGFWPDGIYTPPTEAALKADIASMKTFGFNMVRKHIKWNPPAGTTGRIKWVCSCGRTCPRLTLTPTIRSPLISPSTRSNSTKS